MSLRKRRGSLVLAAALSFIASLAMAQVPPATLDRMADIQVAIIELTHLTQIGKLTNPDYNARRRTLEDEARTVWDPYRQMSRDETITARSAIDRLAKSKLAALEPRWQKEVQAFREEQQKQRSAAAAPSRPAGASAGTGEGQRQGESKPAAPNYDQDVKHAAEIFVKITEDRYKFSKKLIDSAPFFANARSYDAELSRLRKKYYAISQERGSAFENAYTRQAAPAVQAIRVKYMPEQYSPPTVAGSQQPPAASWGFWDFALILGLGLIGWFFWWIFTRLKDGPGDFAPPLTDNYGAAAWAAHQQKPNSDRSIFRGVMFGKSSGPALPPDAPGAPVTSVPEAHTLIVARTRAGKGTRVIVPTLLRYGGSMLVIDPKGENAAITARMRRDQLGQAVHIVNPWGEMQDLYGRLGFQPATFNPLDAIERNDPNAVAVAQTLAATICPAAQGKEQYWQGSAANVLAAVFLWLADRPGEKKTLARAREIVTMSRKDFLEILAKMVSSTGYHGAVKEMVSQYVDLAPETYSGIMSNLAENTKFLSDPRIKAATNTSSFSMDKLRDVLTTVYLVIPHDRIQTHATWLRLVIASAMQALKGRNALTAPPPHRCMFLIDEFGSIGHIADIPRDIALMSGYGLDFTLIVQGLDQLKNHYGEAQGTILSNCGYKWFCYVNDLETAKYLSESLGKETKRTIGKSKSFGSSGGGATEGESTNYGEVGRSLLTPDEVLTLGRDVAVLLHPFGDPHYLRPVDYWRLPEAFAHLRAEYPHFYWEPPLAYDPNPYAPQSRNQDDGAKKPASSKMSAEQAREVLEVTAHATADEIRAAYRRLMAKVHPDKGGTNFFAQQLNAAKAVLLGE